MNTLSTAIKIEDSRVATIGDLRRGQWAAMFNDSSALQRILYADDNGRGLVRVEWDHGVNTRARVRMMAAGNRVQICEQH